MTQAENQMSSAVLHLVTLQERFHFSRDSHFEAVKSFENQNEFPVHLKLEQQPQVQFFRSLAFSGSFRDKSEFNFDLPLVDFVSLRKKINVFQ